jgi:hypothetical protein
MGRRIVYLAGAALVGATALFAFLMPEIRLALIAIGVAFALAAWWVSRRVASETASVRELRGAALVSLLAGFGAAVLVPSTRVRCDCPPPLGATGGYFCNCPIDQHVALRIALAMVGVVLSMVLVATARRRTPVS